MEIHIRRALPADEQFLWEMLYYAAHMAEDGATSPQAARENVFLAPFVAGWGQPGDLGVLAVDLQTNQPVGAAWLRVLHGQAHRHHGITAPTPELAVAVLPDYVGRGIGAQLLVALLAAAQGCHRAVVLSVRVDNPARRLYERCGFTALGEVQNRVGGRSLIMIKEWQGKHL